MKIITAVENFLLHIKLHHSIGNWKYYRSHLMHFHTWCAQAKIQDLSKFDQAALVDYISSMRETCANITINHRIGCLKRLYRFLGIRFDELTSIEKFKERRKTFDMLSKNDLIKIREYIKKLPNKVSNNLYYKSMILILMDTGARINEILMIEEKNCNLVDREIMLTMTKTKEDRVVFISKVTAEVLEEMIRTKEKNNHRFLLHNFVRNRPGSYDDVIFIMKKLKNLFGLKKLHAHMFRHSMASIWLREGSDIRSVMDVLGHKNLETTERYLHESKEHAKAQYEKYDLD